MGLPRAIETGRHMLDDDIRLKLPKINCPTLVVRGEKDPISTQKWNEYVASHIPHAQLKVIPNAPHCINYATPAQLTKVILEFISESVMNGKSISSSP
jgi:pimeloyl-ACP methyl ester carboxylesterase